MKKRTNRRTKVLSFILAILTALNSVCFAIPAAAVEPPVKWKLYSGRPSDDPDVLATDEYYADADYDKDDPTPEPASGVRKLYLVTYLSDEKYQRPDDEIELVRLGEDFDIDDSALQIGTATEPFKGTITFDDTAIFAIKTTKALFAYLSTDATITYTARNTEFVIKPTALVQNDSALFADHIVKGTVKDTLDLKIKCVIPSAGDKYYAGVIGTMDAGAKVNLWYDASEVHGSFSQGDFTANVYSHGNAGLLCGTMKAGAQLTVKSLDVDTTNPTSVTSEFGAAGGLVGAMECGAGLTLECDYDASMISVAANGSSAAGFETPYVPPVLTMMAMSPKRSLPSDPYGIDDDSEAAAETRSVPLRGLNAKTVPTASFDYYLGKDTETALDYDLGKDTEPAIKPETKTESARRGTKGPLRNQTPSPHVKFPTLTEYDTYAGYAGGIVGYAAGATVTFASGVTVTVSNATPGAVSGKTAAGGVAGYALDDSYTVGNDTIPAPVRLILQDDAALTVSGKADAEEYAGGIYGYYQSNDARTNGGVTKGTGEITLSGTYSSTKSNKYCGGVFGYYEAPSQTQSFILSAFTIDDPTLSSAGSTGGVIGYLKADGDVTITGDNYPSGTAYGSILAGGTQLGGLIGTYKNNGALSNTMSISGVRVASALGSSSVSSGGLIGAVADAAAYISAGYIDAAFSGTALFGGGLIGDLGSHGSFLDVSDTVAVDGTVYGGLVGNLGAGVLRLRGTTDVSSADTTSGGQLVYQMDRGLVYALGDGNGTGTGWTLKRKGSGNLDDIYSWGEVVRIGANGVTENESDLFTVDGTAHTVTVKAAVPAMATKLDFAKTALNIQLNTDANVGALQFTAGNENKSSTLLSGALSITDDIDLSGTGLIGLTRDDGANAAYQGTFNGNGKTLTLATGEAYGVNSALTPLTSPRNCGGIYAHGYVGLFAKAGGGSSQQIKNLKIGGTINAYPNVADNRVGGIVAQVVGNLELHTVETFQTINGMGTASASIGGAIGEVKSNNAAVKVTSSQFRTDMTDADTNRSGNIGGVIGSVASSGNTLTFTTVTLGADQAGQQTTAVSVARYGGLIGTIFSASTNRKVELKGVTVAGLAVTAKNGADKLRSGGLGGLLGYSWLSTDVEILSADQLQIGKTGYTPSFTVTGGKYGNFAGLVYRATGYWDIVGLTLTGATFTNNANTGGSFGMLVNEGTGSDGALYLELKQFDNGTNHYDISAATVSSTKKLNVFDELVAYTVSGSEITANNAAIVSVHTTDGADVAMNGSSCNTYQNQTAYGKTAANTGRAHSYSRYYYNLDKIRAKVEASQALRPGEKLLLWSLQKYASSKISGYFTGHGFSGNTIPAANYDMLGLSYYPVSVNGVTVSAGATLKFYNEQIEAGEGVGSGGSDSLVRSTRTATQHLMMHSGLLYNTSCLTVNGVTLQGSVGATSGNVAGAVNGSGFLVRGTLHDGEGEEERSTIQNVQLDGAVVSAGNDDYAPLLINKVGSDTDTEPTKLTVDGVWVVKDNNGTTQYAENAKAASSLIGDAAGVKMTLRFRHISLDGRDGAKSIGTLDADYGTKQSLFTRATLLNKFEYSDALSSGSYTYSKDDDYGANAKRVTYGKEIDVVPAEFTGYTQNMYYDDSGKFTHPVAAADSAYGHFNNTNDANYPVWLPYVYTRYNDENHTHELAINQKLATMGSEGCGTYDDPYPISSGSQLATIAKIINGTEPENGYALRLPATLNPNATHGDPASCDSYAFNSSTHKFGTTYTFDEVREYLAGAYYYLKNDIVIEDANFPGLGAASLSSINNEYQYAFRGAISGKKNDSEVYTITNQTDKPLIANSNGCVVRDLKVVVEKDVTINSTGSGDYYTYYSGLNSYGILIGKVMGGDTFIDKVDVSFGTGYALTIGGDNYRYVPVGGYVGVLANGCVVFRNMAANCGLRGGNFADLNTAANAANYLYANPLIGRVLNGFAFSEGCDVDNTSKDYEIPKLNPNETSKLSNNAGTITVPNGQALWVLGAIVNSGAAAAASAGAYPTGTDNEALFSGFRKYTAVRCGSGGSSTLFAGYEDCNYKTEAGKTPYIITAYADASCRTAATYATTTVNITGDCSGDNKVPKGFRGIGRLYWISGNANNTEPKKYRLNGTVTVQGTDAAGTTPTQRVVELDMKLREYFVETKYRSSRDFAVAGFGLINYMYANEDKLTAKNLTMKGGVSYKVYKNNRTEFTDPTSSDIDSNPGGYPNLNVGAVVGQLRGNLTMTDVLMDTLKIEGFKHAGGLVGQCSTSNSSVKEFTRCGSTNEGVLTLETMYTAGGLAGHIKNPKKVTIDGGTGTTVRIDLIESHITNTPNYVSAGGLVGFCYKACNDGMTIKKMNVVGAGTNKLITTSGLALDQNSGVGGLIGVVSEFGNLTIEHCEVSGVNLWGKNAGGAIGWVVNMGDGKQIKLDDVEITGATGNAAKPTIRGMASGGLLGNVENSNANTLLLQNCTVSGYAIACGDDAAGTTASNTTSERAAGGFIGLYYRNSNSASKVYKLDLANMKAENCDLSTEYTKENDRNGIGGMIGVLRPNGTCGPTVTGNNILLKGLLLTQKGSFPGSGALVGSNSGGYGVVKLAAVSVQNVKHKAGANDAALIQRAIGKEKASNPAPTDEFNGTGGYVIFADYGGASAELSANTTEALLSTTGTAPNTRVVLNTTAGTQPYVPANPKKLLDSTGTFLTGDGLATGNTINFTKQQLPIFSILGDTGDFDYQYAKDNDSTGFDTARLAASSFTTYLTEETDHSGGYDVAALLINSSENIDEAHYKLNTYLDMLTNTRYNYASSEVSGICNVKICNLDRNEQTKTFSVSGNGTSGASVEVGSGETINRFVVKSYDNTKNRLTLLDLQFLDPADQSTVVYHLYVPVFVRKVIDFSFRSGLMNDTLYTKNNSTYTSRSSVQNSGSPVTLWFSYSLDRSASEWATALESGEKLVDSFRFTLKMDQLADALPSTTDLVLVEKSTGKAYYSTFGSAVSNGVLSLSAFSDTSGGHPREIADLLGFSMAAHTGEGKGKFVVAANAAETTFKMGGVSYRPYNSETDSAVATTTYDLNTNNQSYNELTAAYYLSFLTTHQNSGGISRYQIDCPKTLSGTPASCSHWNGETSGQYSNLFLGDIFDVSDTDFRSILDGCDAPTQTESSTPYVVTKAKSTIHIHAQTTVTLQNYQVTSFSEPQNQAFVVFLKRTDATGSKTAIYGDPTLSGTYTITQGGVTSSPVEYAPAKMSKTDGFAQFMLNNPLTLTQNADTATIEADLYISYNGNANAIKAQFPSQTETNGGTEVFLKSSISSASVNVDQIAYSTSFERVTNDGYNSKYFSEDTVPEAYLSFDPVIRGENGTIIEKGDFGKLGINPKDPGDDVHTGDLTHMEVDTIAVLDYSAYLEKYPLFSYDTLKLTLTLQQKEDSHDYGDSLYFDTYFNSITVAGTTFTANDLNVSSFEKPIPKNGYGFSEFVDADGYASIPISFDVKTGTVLENAGLRYANYKVTLTVQLYRSTAPNTGLLTAGLTPQHIIYTNAKIYPDFIG